MVDLSECESCLAAAADSIRDWRLEGLVETLFREGQERTVRDSLRFREVSLALGKRSYAATRLGLDACWLPDTVDVDATGGVE